MLYVRYVFVKIDGLIDQAFLLLTEKEKREIKCNTKIEMKQQNSIDTNLKIFTEGHKIY